jgi:hypothetical protein
MCLKAADRVPGRWWHDRVGERRLCKSGQGTAGQVRLAGGTVADNLKSRCLSAHSYKAQAPPFHRTHLRASRRTWRTVARATHTPSILVLPGPHPAATCVTMLSCGASGAGVMACAEVAIVKAKPPIAINLSIVLLLCVVRPARGGHSAAPDVDWQKCVSCLSGWRGLIQIKRDAASTIPRHMPVRTMAIGAIVRGAHLS